MQPTAEHFEFLDDLRASGDTNMFGARPYLVEEFGINSRDAGTILSEWIRTFDPARSASDRAADASA